MSVWLAVGIALASVLSAVAFYWRNYTRLTRGKFFALATLRAVGILALLGCLFRPALYFEKIITRRSKAIILVDTSKSMSLVDARGENIPTRFERVQKALIPFVSEIRADFDVELYRFDAELVKLKDISEIKDYKPTGLITTLHKSLIDVWEAHKGEDIAAIIPITDGIDNSAAGDLDAVKAVGAKVYPVGVGTDYEQPDIVVKNVVTEDFVVIGNKTPIKVVLRTPGFTNTIVKILLRDADGKVVQSLDASLDATGGEQEFTIEYTPRDKAKNEFEILVPPDKLEKSPDNNSVEFQLNIVEPNIYVLYIEGSVRREYKWLKRVLDKDPQVELIALCRVRKNIFQQSGHIKGITLSGLPTPEQLKQFKVLILGDLDRTYLRRELLEAIKERVEEGMGFAMLGGANSFGGGGYAGTPIEEILPVMCGSRDVTPEGDLFSLKLTREGMVHPIFTGITDYFDGPNTTAKRALNTLKGCVRIPKVKTTAKVLAVHPFKKEGGRFLPILAIYETPDVRVAAFAVDTTYRWRNIEDVYRKFWGQLVRWLAQREIEKKPGVTVKKDRPSYEPGDKVRLTAEVRGEKGKPESKAKVTAALTGPEEKKFKLEFDRVKSSEGDYTFKFDPPLPGIYHGLVTAEKDGQVIGTAKLKFAVGNPSLELQEQKIRVDELKQIALDTGGQYFFLANIGNLYDTLEARLQRERIPRTYDFDKPLVLLVALFAYVGLITTELALRRNWQLV